MALYANGRAPDDALVIYRGVKASPDMAARVAWVEREYMKRNPNGYIRPNEIYRDYEAQVFWKLQEILGNTPSAAEPGYSNHGDWNVGAVDWNADNIALRDELAEQVGLVRTVPSESWHYAVRGPSRVPLPNLAGGNYIELEEDDMFSDEDRALAQATNRGVVDAVLRLYSIEGKIDQVMNWVGINKWALTGNENSAAGLRSIVHEGFTKLGVELDEVQDDLTKLVVKIAPTPTVNLKSIQGAQESVKEDK